MARPAATLEPGYRAIVVTGDVLSGNPASAGLVSGSLASGSLASGIESLGGAVSALEAAFARRSSRDALAGDADTERRLMREDRSRLAADLEIAADRCTVLEAARADASERLRNAIESLDALLTASAGDEAQAGPDADGVR